MDIKRSIEDIITKTSQVGAGAFKAIIVVKGDTGACEA